VFGHVFRRLAEEDRPLRFVASRVLWHSGLSHRFSVERRGGPGAYRMRFFPSAVSSMAWVYPERLSAEEAFVARALRPGDSYVDVGANVGLLALRAASVVGPTGRVVAIEAHPRTASFLANNVRLNGFGNVAVERVAVGDTPGELAFTDRRSDDQNAVAPDGAGPVQVAVTTLDALVPASRLPHVHLLKIDVEGFELAALRGAAQLLARVDRLLIESNPAFCLRYGYRSREVFDLLRLAGFRLRLLDGSSWLPENYEPAGPVDLVAERSP
jgi:FkbM family methyltransferase